MRARRNVTSTSRPSAVLASAVRVIVIGDLVDRLGLRPQILGVPDAGLVAVLEQPTQHARGQRGPGKRSHPGHELDVVKGERHVGRLALRVGLDRIPEQQVLRLDGPLSHLDDEGLPGSGLRQVVSQTLGESGSLALQVGHEGQHRHGVPAGRMGRRMKHHLLPGLDERLLGQRTPQKLRDGVGDLVACTPEARILGVACLRQRSGGRFPHDPPGPSLRIHVGPDHLLELKQQRRVFVPAQEPEEHPVPQLERPAGAGPLELKQSAVLGNGPDVLDAQRRRSRQPQQVPAPDPGVLLLLHYRLGGLRLDDRQVGSRDALRGGVPGGGKFGERAVPDRWPGVFEQPGQRNPVLVGQFQKRSWEGGRA